MRPRQRFAERLVRIRGRSSVGVTQGCCIQLLRAIWMAPLACGGYLDCPSLLPVGSYSPVGNLGYILSILAMEFRMICYEARRTRV